QVQALVIADRVYVDESTQKKVIAGTFDTMWSPAFPAVFGQVSYAYVCLVDCWGPTEIELRYVDRSDEDQKSLLDAKVTVNLQNKNQSVEMIVQLPPLPMPHEGEYAFELVFEGSAIGSKRMYARQTASPKR